MSRTTRNHNWSSRWWTGIKDEALGRDKKPGSRPPGWWKQLRRRARRRKQLQALLRGMDLPVEKKTDIWDWN